MAEQIHLNAFTLACPSPQFWGAWKLPNDESAEGFLSLDYWIKFAGILERGKFDALFFADTMGVSDVYGGSEAAVLRNGVFAPAIDPTILIAALAGRTSHSRFRRSPSRRPMPGRIIRRASSRPSTTSPGAGWRGIS